MIAFALAAVLTLSRAEQCAETFDYLTRQSIERADLGKYAQAGALREAAADLYETCHEVDHRDHAFFPYDEPDAYATAATFWQLAGYTDHAKALAQKAYVRFLAIERSYRKTVRGRLYDANRDEVYDTIKDEMHGRWGAWSEPGRDLRLLQNCVERFDRLVAGSSDRADKRRYAEAAELRERAGDVYQTCGHGMTGTDHGFFPFDGANAYAMSAMLWHMAGYTDRAKKALALARRTLLSIQALYPRVLMGPQYNLNFNQVKEIVDSEARGGWPIWGSAEPF